MNYFIELDKYYPSIKTKMWKNNELKNVIAKMATNGASTTLLCAEDRRRRRAVRYKTVVRPELTLTARRQPSLAGTECR